MKKGRIAAVLSVGLLSVGLLSVVALSGTAFAHWGGWNSDATYEEVAETLGTDADSVDGAFSQASAEANDAALQSRLDALVLAERITQEQADEIMDWYNERPDAIDGIVRGGRVDLTRVAEILGADEETLETAVRDARETLALEAYQTRLDEAVANGTITQEQAGDMLERYQAAIEDRMGFGRGHHGHRGHFGPGFGGGFPRVGLIGPNH